MTGTYPLSFVLDLAKKAYVEAMGLTEEDNEADAYVVREGRRTVIEKMVFENFKSYAGVQEVGPFHKNFSAVVGPNGSG